MSINWPPSDSGSFASPQQVEMIQLLSDWIKSGDVGDYVVSQKGRKFIVFHRFKLIGFSSWEIALNDKLIATVWYKDAVLKVWDLHDPSSLEELGEILRRHGINGIDPRHLTRERTISGADPIRLGAGRSFVEGDSTS